MEKYVSHTVYKLKKNKKCREKFPDMKQFAFGFKGSFRRKA